MTYTEAVAYLESLVDFERLGFRRHFADTVSLDSLRALLALLDNPQHGLPCVHIAGTKGKGSVAAMLDSILRAAGLHTGLFTSPHLVSFRERIRLDGRLATERQIASLVARAQPAIEQLRAEGKLNPSTFFEAYTAMAYLQFQQHEVDLAVMETGLGGRLDATNTCEPVVCAITTLGLDHTEILGDTIEQIAAEKAGILKPGVPAVCAPQQPAAQAVLAATAGRVGAPLFPAPAVLDIVPAPRLGVPEDQVGNTEAPVPIAGQQVTLALDGGPVTMQLPLAGAHQATNLAVAVGVVARLRERGYGISDEALAQGVRKVSWPGRLQIAGSRPWLVFDAAHNQPSAHALAATLPQMIEYDRLIAVIGLSVEKDALGFCRELAPLVDLAVLTRAKIDRALPVADLADLTRDLWREMIVGPDVPAALALAQQRAGVRDCILVTGSFYVVGEVMEALERGPLRGSES